MDSSTVSDVVELAQQGQIESDCFPQECPEASRGRPELLSSSWVSLGRSRMPAYGLSEFLDPLVEAELPQVYLSVLRYSERVVQEEQAFVLVTNPEQTKSCVREIRASGRALA